MNLSAVLTHVGRMSCNVSVVGHTLETSSENLSLAYRVISGDGTAYIAKHCLAMPSLFTTYLGFRTGSFIHWLR